jgi:hypothetical protein
VTTFGRGHGLGAKNVRFERIAAPVGERPFVLGKRDLSRCNTLLQSNEVLVYGTGTPMGRGIHLFRMTYDASKGTLHSKHTMTTLPDRFAGTNYTSGIIVSLDGKCVYGLNRLHDSIAIFEIDQTSGDVRRGVDARRLPAPSHDRSHGPVLVRSQSAGRQHRDVPDRGRQPQAYLHGQYTPIGNPNRMLFL